MSGEATRDARGVAVNVAGLLAQVALPAFHVQLARFLGASGYGVYMWSQAFVDVFAVVTLFGCDQAVMRQVSLARENASRAVGSALRVVVVSGVVVFVAIFFGAPWIANVQNKPELVGPLRCLALVPIFYHASTVLLVATQAIGVMRFAFWARSIAQPLVLLVATGVALRAGFGPSGAAAAVAIGMAATALVALIFYARAFPLGPAVRAAFSGRLDRDMLRVAFPLMLAGVLWALTARVDAFFLGHYGSDSDLGAYAACVLYATSITQLRGAFEPTTSALVAPALAKHDARGLSLAIQRQTRWLALVSFPLAALFIGFGAPLLAVFGHGFARGHVALAALAIGHVANALALSSFAIPLGGYGRLTTIVAAVTLLVQSIACVVLVPRYGVLGAAIAMSTGLVVAQLAQSIIAAKVLGVVGVSSRVLVVAFGAAIGVACGRVAFAEIRAATVPRFFISVAIAAIVYAGFAWALALTRDDRDLASELWRGTLRRARKMW